MQINADKINVVQHFSIAYFVYTYNLVLSYYQKK